MGWGEELSRAYKLHEGETAYREYKSGGSRVPNPYPKGSEDHDLWNEGWHNASWQDTMKF